ncbi:hypothetical protein Trydic_g17996 [Trypoxylus dichotomus]
MPQNSKHNSASIGTRFRNVPTSDYISLSDIVDGSQGFTDSVVLGSLPSSEAVFDFRTKNKQKLNQQQQIAEEEAEETIQKIKIGKAGGDDGILQQMTK